MTTDSQKTIWLREVGPIILKMYDKACETLGRSPVPNQGLSLLAQAALTSDWDIHGPSRGFTGLRGLYNFSGLRWGGMLGNFATPEDWASTMTETIMAPRFAPWWDVTDLRVLCAALAHLWDMPTQAAEWYHEAEEIGSLAVWGALWHNAVEASRLPKTPPFDLEKIAAEPQTSTHTTHHLTVPPEIVQAALHPETLVDTEEDPEDAFESIPQTPGPDPTVTDQTDTQDTTLPLDIMHYIRAALIASGATIELEPIRPPEGPHGGSLYRIWLANA